MTRPGDLPEHERGHLNDLLASCPHLTVLAEQVRLAALLTTRRGADLEGWMSAVEATDLPTSMSSFVACARICPLWSQV